MELIYDKSFIDKYLLDQILVESKRFTVKFAVSSDELAEVLALRREIFRVERDCDRGGSDRDSFDDYAFHMLLIDRETDRIIGTYRAILGEVAMSRGFYTAQEYDLAALGAERLRHACEVGRSCIMPEYRNGGAIMLLWSGISEMRKRYRFQYLIGCASLDSTDVAKGYACYHYLKNRGYVSDEIDLVPRYPYAVDDPGTGEEFSASDLPPLIKGYLRIGAKIAGKPTLDQDFKCIDLPVWFDFDKLTERYNRHFISESRSPEK